MIWRTPLLSLLPILILLNAGCSRSSSQQEDLRQQQETRELLDLKLKCAELGRRFDTDNMRDRRGSGPIPLASRFAYNAKLNTCLYRGGFFTPTGFLHYFIVDLATNEELASYMTDPSGAILSQAEQRNFDQREFELFGPKPD